jgi:predicted permease
MKDILRTILARLKAAFRQRRLDEEFDAELREHVEMAFEANLRRGLTPEAARREALISLGGVEQIKQLHREHRGLPMIDTMMRDIRFGFRMLWRSRGFSILAILCLTLGIGANAAVFSWIEGILFRPYPMVVHQERLMAMAGTSKGEPGGTGLSWPDFQDLRRNSTLFETMIVSQIMGTTLSVGDRAERAVGSIVSANYFDATQVHPILGRGFAPEEEMGSAAHPVAVISYQLWKGRYNGDPKIIGKTQRLNGVVHTIIGVAPEGFYGTFVGWAMQFWVPASMEETFGAGGYKLEDRSARWAEAYAIAKPGVTLTQAQQEITAIATRLENDYPSTNRGRSVQLFPLWQTPFNNARTLLPTLGIMLVVVVFVLLIACANVGNLLLVRSFARRHEMTVRTAIGASRGHLLKQLLTEGLILSVLSAASGLMVAHWCRHALVLLFPLRSGAAMYLPGEIDWRVLAVSAGVCLLTTLLVGLIPALQTTKVDIATALKSEMAGVVGGGRGRSWVRSGLVLVQVSLSFLLLVGTGLLMESLQKIREADPGFATRDVQITGVDLLGAGYEVPRAKTFEDELIDRVKAMPEVDSAVFARLSPLGYRNYSSSVIAVDGYQPPPEEQPSVAYNEVGTGYLATMGIPLLAGREFTRADDENGAPVAVVNQTMAAKYWQRRNPVGDRLQVKGRWLNVVGVAKDSKYRSMREAPIPFFYVPLRQNFSTMAVLHIRTKRAPDAVAVELARRIHELDGNLAPYEVITLQEQVERSTSAQQVAVTLLAVLGSLALVLAAIGLYAVMSYTVSQSTREMGLRMALGAKMSDVLRLVMSQGLTLAGAGILVGLGVGLGLTRLLGSLLFHVSPRDPATFAGALVVMAVVAVAACILPAWRATRTDPMKALRDE